MMQSVTTEFRLAARRLWMAPSFSATVLITLAVAFGALSVGFVLVNDVLLRPLPYDHADRLVEVWFKSPMTSIERFRQSPGTFLHIQREARHFEHFGIGQPVALTVGTDDDYERVAGMAISASMFDVFSVPIAMGRRFTTDDQSPSATPVVAVSERFWRTRLAGRSTVVGERLTVDGVERTIVTVLEAGFSFPDPATEVLLPVELDEASPEVTSFTYVGYARLEPGIDLRSIDADFERLIPLLSESYPEKFPVALLERVRFSGVVIPLRTAVAGDASSTLWAVLGAGVVVLLMAMANVANLFLVRNDTRARESAVRLALGASGARLARAWFLETVILVGGGAVCGLLGAAAAMVWLERTLEGTLPRLQEVSLSGFELAAAGLLATAVALALTLLTFRGSEGQDLGGVLREGKAAVGGRPAVARLRNTLLMLQVCVSLVLVASSGVLLRSFVNLSRVETGIAAEGVLGLRLFLPESDYPDAASTSRAYDQIISSVQQVPGVTRVGAVTNLPLRDNRVFLAVLPEDDRESADAFPSTVLTKAVTGDYFQAMGIPLLQGRLLTGVDREEDTGALVISDVLASRFWPGEAALGKRILLAAGGGRVGGRPHEVVGVVASVRDRSISEPPVAMIYVPQTAEWEHEGVVIREMSLAVKSADGAVNAEAVQRVIADFDRRLPVYAVARMSDTERTAVAPVRFTAQMLSVASFISLLLGAVGLYGALSYQVALRHREVGLRIALGASSGAVTRMVLRQGARLTVAGLAMGIGVALLVAPLIESMTYGVSAFDPMSALLSALVLTVVALLAASLPAYRATRVDPSETLKTE